MISPPEIVYRFFSDEGHRLAFLEGNIRLSTLEICRNHKAPWGDATEATETILSGYLKGGSHDKEFVQQAEIMSIGIGPGCKNKKLPKTK